MPVRHYTTIVRADVRETWAIDSAEPLTSDEVMEIITDANPSRLEFVVAFVDEEVVPESEGDREFERCVGEPIATPAEQALDQHVDRQQETWELCQALATVALNGKVEDQLPFGLKERVERWLASGGGQ